jgi:hypothetical protein
VGNIQCSSIDEQLRFAIANKRLIQVGYRGDLRIAEPHDYGLQHGAANLLIYQLRGSRRAPGSRTRGWKMLNVSKIDTCLILDETFPGSRGQSGQHHFDWDVVYARVT